MRLAANSRHGVVFVKDNSDSKLEDFIAAKAASAVLLVGGGVLSELACTCRSLGIPTVVLAMTVAKVEVVETTSPASGKVTSTHLPIHSYVYPLIDTSTDTHTHTHTLVHTPSHSCSSPSPFFFTRLSTLECYDTPHLHSSL